MAQTSLGERERSFDLGIVFPFTFSTRALLVSLESLL